MKYLYLLVIVIIISVVGYYAGQYFYKEKVNISQNTSKPLILPLIEEKKYVENTTNPQPLVIVPTTNNPSNENNKNESNKNDSIKGNIKKDQTTIQNTIETAEKTETQKTEYQSQEKNNPEDNNQKETQNKEYPEAEPGLYYIQVGSFLSLENAQSVKKQLESLGLNPKIEEVINGNSLVYRVIIGNYKTQEEAMEESNKLKRMGFDNIVKNY